MQKNTLIINTRKFESTWFEYFNSLSQHDFNLQLLSNDQQGTNHFKANNWPTKTFKILLQPEKNSLSAITFRLLRPFMLFTALVQLLFFKFSKKIDIIICFGVYEKLHFTRIAKFIGIKVIWIINPNGGTTIPKITEKSLSRLSKHSSVVCLSQKCKNKLTSKKNNLKNVTSIKIGIKNKHNLEQKNIFETLAKKKSDSPRKKFFTIGTIQELDGDISQIEKLLHATKKSIEIIPQIQLIIAGDGPQRKKLTWMAQKMNIDNLVWFVGNHKHPQKWLSNFDLYISTSPQPTLDNLKTLILASFDGLSVIASNGLSFSEFIIDKKTGLLIDIDKSEDLTDAIINLQQDHNKRLSFGKNGQKHILDNFQFDKTIQDLCDILRK